MRNVLIIGAAGKDFHVFNTLYRDRPDVRVVAFTAAQIPNIDGRRYPPQLAGPRYPEGIPIASERDLSALVRDLRVDEAVFAYSDVSYDYVDERRKKVEAAGATFSLPDPRATMLPARKPVVAVCAVRTGSGKSQTTRRAAEILRRWGKRVVAVRHPMPYGDLVRQEVQRFADLADLAAQRCTIEEMEEYEPHLRRGCVVYAGVDYGKILRRAEGEADIILWDGGNNDTPFFKPDLHLVVADPLRQGHELTHYPGRVNFEMAHAIIINKCDSATPEQIAGVEANAKRCNPGAVIVRAESPIFVEDGDSIRGKRVLVVEDGPTVTHGGMKFGAGVIAAKKYGAREIVDPRPFLCGTLNDTFAEYPDIGTVLPAMGYGDRQVRDLGETIDRSDADLVVIGTPIDLRRIVKIAKPAVRVTYELKEIGKPDLEDLLGRFR